MKEHRPARLAAGALPLALFLLCACAAPPVDISSFAPPPADIQHVPEQSRPPVSAQTSVPAGTPKEEPVLENPVHFAVRATRLEGNLIGEPLEREVSVCLPAGYNESDERYPVLYHLTGYSDNNRGREGEFLQALHALDARLIVVVIDGFNRLAGSWYTNSPVTGNWADYVTADVVNAVDAAFRTVPKPEARGVSGHSMGGAGALHIAMRQPGVFGAVYAMSPAIFARGGLEAFAPGFDLLEQFAGGYAGLSPAEATQRVLHDMDTLDFAYCWPLAYACAFAYDADAAPYFQLPAKDASGAWQHDEVWARYVAGGGNLSEKIQACAENLKGLRGLAVDYGEQDELAWLPEGCRELAALLSENGVPCQVEGYEGGHGDRFVQRINENVLPYFISLLSAGKDG